MKHQKAWAAFFLAASVLTAALIFWFSAQKGADSQAMSDRITLRVATIVRPDFMRLPVDQRRSYLALLSTVIRKNAHFCEYMLLGFNLMGYARFRNLSMPARGGLLRAWGIATLYAATDEAHQMFVNEREAMFVDVLIDSAGGLTGALVMILAITLLARLARRWKRRRTE